MKIIKLHVLCVLLLTLMQIVGSKVAFAENMDPLNDGSQYAYAENIGWLNFEPGFGEGVSVDDLSLTGYIWAENIGWINLSPIHYGGVVNDGIGHLSGYAWSENAGWINFDPEHGGVSIDSEGNFSGWAWGENIGWTHFQGASYKVQTSWQMPDVNVINLNLPAGWSMISLPVLPDNTSVTSLFPGAVVVYGYKKGVGYERMSEEDDLKVGKGYWILLKEEKTYTITGRTIHEYILSANEEGWHIIGGCTGLAKAFMDDCTIGVIYAYEQGKGYKRLLESEGLTSGQGYWLLFKGVFGQCDLTVQCEKQEVSSQKNK